MTEAERNALAPSGKVAQWTGFEGNGGCVRKRADGTYTWFNNFRRLYKWSTTNDTYRTVLSFWTPVPDDKILLLHAELWLYQKNPFNTICGAQVRLMANQVESQPENVWNWIGGGDLIREDWQIARPEHWVWQNNDALDIVNRIRGGAVHFGLMGNYEGNPNSPCAIGKWGADDAPDWPEGWVEVGIPEPTTYGIVIVNLQDPSEKKVRQPHAEPDTWGHLKEMSHP